MGTWCSHGTRIPTIWSSGQEGSRLRRYQTTWGSTNEGGRIDVQADLTVSGLRGVYALGDFANILGKDR